MKIKIEKLSSKQVETKNGTRTTIGVYDGEKWLSLFEIKGVTDKWEEGDEIEGEIVQNGKYWNLKLPVVGTNNTAGEGNAFNILGKMIKENTEMLKEIRKDLKALTTLLTTDEAPVINEAPETDDVPF